MRDRVAIELDVVPLGVPDSSGDEANDDDEGDCGFQWDLL
jgi:hypothetical protein